MQYWKMLCCETDVGLTLKYFCKVFPSIVALCSNAATVFFYVDHVHV